LKNTYPGDRPQVMVALSGDKQAKAIRTSFPKAVRAPTSSPEQGQPGQGQSGQGQPGQPGQGQGKSEDTVSNGRQVGPFLAYPEVGTTVVHDSNIFQSPDNEKSSLVFTIKPGLKLERSWQGSNYALALASPIGIYANSSNDNYLDGQFSAQADWKLPRSLGLKFLGEYMRGHDSRGGTDRPDAGEPNTWHSGGMSVTGSYGRKEARARLEAGGKFTLKRYDKFGLSEKLDDKNLANLHTTLFYQVLPKTYLLGKIQYANTDYVSENSKGDSNEMKYSVGATWEATAKTSANLEVGYSNRDYDATGVEKVSGLYWNAGLQWKPLGHSILDLTTSKSVDDATGIGSYISQQNVGMAWKHKWSSRILSTANFSIAAYDYGGSSRTDDLYNYGANLTYQYRKWLDVGAGVQMNHRDSNNNDFDYDKTVFSVNLRATF
jgi:polysaccharide biosynthesis protein VpsM